MHDSEISKEKDNRTLGIDFIVTNSYHQRYADQPKKKGPKERRSLFGESLQVRMVEVGDDCTSGGEECK